MSKQEFILLIPAIVYGVAIVELLKSFKVTNYWELIYTGTWLMLNSIILWLTLFNQLDFLIDNNINLLLVLLQAILFAKSAEMLTPEEKDTDTKAYYEGVIRYVILLQVFVFMIAGINEILIFDDRQNYIVRPVAIALGIIAVFWPNKYYRRFVLFGTGLTSIGVLIGIIQ